MTNKIVNRNVSSIVSFEPHKKWVKEHIINSPHPYIWVDKGGRFGLTVSTGKVCYMEKIPFTEIAPTNRILVQTIGGDVMDKKEEIKGWDNKDEKGRNCSSSKIHPTSAFAWMGRVEYMCPNSYPDEFFGFYRTDCINCELKGTDSCKFSFVSRLDPSIPTGITYDNFRNLFSYNPVMGFKAEEFRNRLKNSKIILLDELARLIAYLPNGFYLEGAVQLKTKISEKRNMLSVNEEFLNVLVAYIDGLVAKYGEIEHKDINCVDSNEYKVYKNTTVLNERGEFISEKEMNKKLREIGCDCKKIMESSIVDISHLYKFFGYKMKENFINILLSMRYEESYIMMKKDDNGNLSPWVIPNITHPFYAVMKPFLEEFVKNGGKVVATGMFLPPFETLPWKIEKMPNFNNVGAKNLIVVDRKHGYYGLDVRGKPNDWYKDHKKIKRMIFGIQRQYSSYRKDIRNASVAVFAFNKNIHENLERWKRDLIVRGLIKEGDIEVFFLTYHRSDYSSGVEMNQRIKFFIGLPETRKDSYIESYFLYGLEHTKMRDMEIGDTTMNELWRGVDPINSEMSMTFIIGGTKERLLELIPKEKQELFSNLVQVFTQGTLYDVSGFYTKLWTQEINKTIFESDRGGKKLIYKDTPENRVLDIIRDSQIPQWIDAKRIILDRYYDAKNPKIFTRTYDISHAWNMKNEELALDVGYVEKLMERFNNFMECFFHVNARKNMWTIKKCPKSRIFPTNELQRFLLVPWKMINEDDYLAYEELTSEINDESETE